VTSPSHSWSGLFAKEFTWNQKKRSFCLLAKPFHRQGMLLQNLQIGLFIAAMKHEAAFLSELFLCMSWSARLR